MSEVLVLDPVTIRYKCSRIYAGFRQKWSLLPAKFKCTVRMPYFNDFPPQELGISKRITGYYILAPLVAVT